MKSIVETTMNFDSKNLVDFISYRDEGNMNLVVSLLNMSSSDEKQVIRFKKIPIDEFGSNVISKEEERNETEIFIRFEESLRKYLENSDHFTVEPKLVYANVDLNLLNEYLLCYRPAARKTKIIGGRYGLLCRDVAFLPRDALLQSHGSFRKTSPTFCIEIKTKQGFIFRDEIIESNIDGIRKCRFCYLQYLKLKGNKIEKISRYCPIDLFSGIDERMNQAICGLLDNPQNNLKILMNGNSVYSEHVKCESALENVLSHIFPDIHDFHKRKTLLVNLIRGILMKNFKETNCVVCCTSPTKFQNLGDIHDRSCLMNPRMKPVAHSILKSVYQAQQLIQKNYTEMENLEKLSDEMNDAKKILSDWSAGSTALDCSVMLSFSRIKPSQGEDGNYESIYHLKLSDECDKYSFDYLVNATIVDLDFKKDSIAHFRKYKRQLQESKMAFSEFLHTRDQN